MSFRDPARYKPILFYLLATLPVMLPLLLPGYVLVLDMVFAPQIPMPHAPTNTYPFYALLHILNACIPSFVIQKILLVGIFVLAGTGAYSLLKSLRPKTNDADARPWQVASYLAGIIYMYNPFVYSRLMAGQYLVLLGYALLPFFLRAVWKCVTEPGLKHSLHLVGLSCAIAFTSIHTLGLALGLSMLAVLVALLSGTYRKQWRRVLRYGLSGAGLILLLNSFWLIPVARGTSTTLDTVMGFSQADFNAFATTGGELGIIGNVLALQGFWGDEKNLYLLPQDLYWFWWVPIGFLWALVVAGALWSWRQQRQLFVLFAVSGSIGLILAAGTTAPVVGVLNEWLATHLSLFAGYREPQKIAALLALAYVYFAAVGAFWLWKTVRDPTGRGILQAMSFALPVACIPLMLWGGWGQLRARDYPRDWYKANEMLAPDRDPDAKALFLPWHLYQPFSFSSGTVATPAPAFFDMPIISSKNPELRGASPYSNDPAIARADRLVGSASAASANAGLPQDLWELGIRYIVVSKTYDYRDYDFLKSAKHIIPISDTENLTIYQITQK